MPLKRVIGLQPLSHDHHHGLLFCWKIRTGFRKNISPARMKSYANWFYTSQLVSHFELEEKYVFPVLGIEHPLVKRALSEHRKLRRLFENTDQPAITLGVIEEKLEAHIRFEERILFHEIQQVATAEEFDEMLTQHASPSKKHAVKEWDDEFWK